jgi:hypothetical protein
MIVSWETKAVELIASRFGHYRSLPPQPDHRPSTTFLRDGT